MGLNSRLADLPQGAIHIRRNGLIPWTRPPSLDRVARALECHGMKAVVANSPFVRIIVQHLASCFYARTKLQHPRKFLSHRKTKLFEYGIYRAMCSLTIS